MDALEMRRRVVSARVGHLGTAAPMPHVVPVCYALVGETAYTAVDHKPKRSTRLQRVANVEATGRACLLAAKYVQYGQRRPPGPVLALEAERWSGWEAR